MQNSGDTIGKRADDLPACSGLPQPTASPCTPYVLVLNLKQHTLSVTEKLSTS